MIENIVRNYLNGKLSVEVYLEKQEKMPKSFVLIERTGGSRSNYINSATFTIQSYASSLYESASLNEAVKNAMEEIANTCDVGNCKLNSDYNYTDTKTKQYRYQAVFNLTF